MIKTKFIKCACHSCAVELTRFDNEKYIYFQIFEAGCKENHSLSFWERLRWCWRVLRKGKPFEDQIVLDFESADAMVEGIKELKNEK